MGCADVFQSNAHLNDEAVKVKIINVLVASSRQKEMDGSYGIGRSSTLSYSMQQVSVPPLVRIGKFTYPQISTDIKRSFRILASTNIASDNAFNKAVISEVRNIYNSSEIVIFVHGFDSNFEKTVFRTAKIDADFEINAAIILYSWPSAGEIGLYLQDIDAADYARNGLEELLSDLSKTNIKKITLVGHSMGAPIIVETLRQLKFKGRSSIIKKIGGVALLSPDLDVDLFVQQAKDIGHLPQPFVIYSSKQDWVIGSLASYFHDGKQRLGNITDFSALKDLSVTIIDNSNIHDTSDSYHFAAASSPTMINLINSMAKVGFDSFGYYAKKGKVAGARVISDGALTTVILGGL